MRYLTITDDSTRAEIEEAMVHLRAKQRACCIALIRDEIGEDISELLDLWKALA